MSVNGAVCVGDVKTMMLGMDNAYKTVGLVQLLLIKGCIRETYGTKSY